MNDNQRLFAAYDFLKRKGHIKTYSDLAEILGTTKSGIDDLRNGKTKVSIEDLRNMVKTYTDISLRWLVLEEGDIEIEVNEEFDISKELLIMQKVKINELKKEIDELTKDLSLYKNRAE
jgi:transcriptional regulator with XRE-family HTH domain